MQEKIYTAYDNECMLYLALEILKALLLEEQFMYIDLYYKAITEIYEDYKLEDDCNVPLLDSIHNYINAHEQEILNKIRDAFDGAF